MNSQRWSRWLLAALCVLAGFVLATRVFRLNVALAGLPPNASPWTGGVLATCLYLVAWWLAVLLLGLIGLATAASSARWQAAVVALVSVAAAVGVILGVPSGRALQFVLTACGLLLLVRHLQRSESKA